MNKDRAELISDLKEKSKEMRKLIIETSNKAGEGHVAPAFSSVELTVALYFHIMNLDPENPEWEDRDRFIFSAGHKCLAQYVALAMKGFYSKDLLDTFDQFESRLGGHPIYGKLPGVEASTGSLGHGLSIGIGMAIAGVNDKKDYRVFTILGDGECDEGGIWEAAMTAPKYKLDNLTAIVDYNKMSVDGFVKDVMPLEPLKEKWESFGWACKQIDGHDMEEVVATLEELPFEKGKPSCIIADTIKGKGVSFIENNPAWHMRAPTDEEAEKAVEEILSQ